MSQKYYNIDIQEFLPHRNPMLMADKILEICPEQVTTIFEIRENNIFVENNQFSEAGITEHMAQTCSSIFGQTFFEKGNPDSRKVVGFITNIKKLKILKLPKTGETITSKAIKISEYENICNVSCQTFCEENLLAEAEINLFIKEI